MGAAIGPRTISLGLLALVGIAASCGGKVDANGPDGGYGSSSSSGGTSSSSSGASTGSGSGSASGSGGGSDSSASSSGSGGASSASSGGPPGCKDPTLHPATPGSIFCGYASDAGSLTCTTGMQCCLGGKMGMGYAPEECIARADTCNNGMNPLPIECEQPEDCMANGDTNVACCLQGATPPMPVSGCDSMDLRSTGGVGIFCFGALPDAGTFTCGAGDMQVCEIQADCPQGKTCTAIRWKLYQIGVCL